MPRILLENVSKEYPQRKRGPARALADLSFEVASGELLVLLGPSGSGKTTLLRLIAGLEQPTRGRILFDGADMASVEPHRRNVGMVFQRDTLFPHLSVRENMALPLKARGTKAADADPILHSLTELLGLNDLLERSPSQLSGGERQRVAIARALAPSPEVILLDEPFSNLDPRLKAELRQEIKRVQRSTGKTTLFVTHDQREALALGDRVAVLRAGRLQQLAPPALLYDRPANLFVATFLGEPPINLLPGELRQQETRLLFVPSANDPASAPSELDLTAHRDRERLTPCLGQKIFLGLRPEFFLTQPSPGALALRVLPRTIEFSGSDTIVYFRWFGHPMTARLPGSIHPRPEEPLDLWLDLHRALFFPQTDAPL